MWQCHTRYQDSVSVIPIFFQDLQPTLPTLPTSQIQLYPQITFSCNSYEFIGFSLPASHH